MVSTCLSGGDLRTSKNSPRRARPSVTCMSGVDNSPQGDFASISFEPVAKMRYQLNLRVDQRDKVTLDLELIDVPEHIKQLPLKPCHTYCVILPMKSQDKHVDVPSFMDGLVHRGRQLQIKLLEVWSW